MKYWLAHMDAWDDRDGIVMLSRPPNWDKIKEKMDLEHVNKLRLKGLYRVGARPQARPPEQTWDKTAVMFADWLFAHDKVKVRGNVCVVACDTQLCICV